MTYARVFQSGNSQAVRLPKEFRFNAEEVEIFRQGNDVVLRERPVSAVAILDALVRMPADFMADGRDDGPPQERELL
ncbi:type II toxin-antitoxin system VapB family antitoxin [Variovorax sp. J22P271]|uniref:antitoxin n=1 Tax=Variovorax davisae TaxID=3053515 RepID=UPI00257624F7|nr:type II toxin-antitoxin system VapB family antitoxin [Variovorax sp. J22P271]MDM0030694.1 type II toxin-antitoxin system VapB family antitoxin [Variovorax sp. J22P271]